MITTEQLEVMKGFMTRLSSIVKVFSTNFLFLPYLLGFPNPSSKQATGGVLYPHKEIPQARKKCSG